MNLATTAFSILKIKSDAEVVAPGYPEENGSEETSPLDDSQQSIENWEIMSQLGLPLTVDSAKSIGKSESGLSYMQAAFFATVLEDFLKSIRIVGECQSTMRRMKANNDMVKLITKKYAIADSPIPPDELAGVTKNNIGCEKFKLKKLISDREYMENVITDTYKELSVNRSYFKLVKANTEYETQRQRYPSIIEEEAKNKSLRKKLRRQLRVQQNVNATNMDTHCASVITLREQIEETDLYSNIEGQFLDRWQKSRIEQQEEFIRRQEMSITQNIRKYKMRQEEEARVHGEMDLLVGILINEMLSEIEHLMSKYEKDTEALDIEIQKKRLTCEEMEKQRMRLENQLAKKKKEMLRWIAYKEEGQRRIEYEKKMHNAALVIQAWWRGMLARHDLGPYRRHKGKKTKRRKKSTNSNATN